MANEQPVRPFLRFKVTKLPTIKVTMKDGGNEVIINESDFDPEKHTLQRIAPSRAAPAKKSVSQRKEKEEKDS